MYPILDIIAGFIFAICWGGYRQIAHWINPDRPNISTLVANYRRNWAKTAMQRENRIIDASLLSSLKASNNFLASTAVIIAGAAFTIIGNADKIIREINSLPLVHEQNITFFQLKLFLFAGIFVYAFFKFAWCIRLYNYCSIILGSMPIDYDENDHSIEAFSQVNIYAGQHFNAGLRAYFFGATVSAWLIHPIVFIIASILTTSVIYRREYNSRSYYCLIPEKKPHKKAP